MKEAGLIPEYGFDLDLHAEVLKPAHIITGVVRERCEDDRNADSGGACQEL